MNPPAFVATPTGAPLPSFVSVVAQSVTESEADDKTGTRKERRSGAALWWHQGVRRPTLAEPVLILQEGLPVGLMEPVAIGDTAERGMACLCDPRVLLDQACPLADIIAIPGFRQESCVAWRRREIQGGVPLHAVNDCLNIDKPRRVSLRLQRRGCWSLVFAVVPAASHAAVFPAPPAGAGTARGKRVRGRNPANTPSPLLL